jgi:stage IV sporulation protein FB
MRGVKLDISAGALLIFALAYFFDSSGVTSALLPAIAVHEMGHMAALTLCHARLHRLSLNIFGLKLDYSGSLSRGETLISALAGPAAGVVYAVAALAVGTDFFRMSGAASLLLSAFNMLPALPLDGGRVLQCLTNPISARHTSRVVAAVMMATGVWALFSQGWLSPLMIGGWLLIYNGT